MSPFDNPGTRLVRGGQRGPRTVTGGLFPRSPRLRGRACHWLSDPRPRRLPPRRATHWTGSLDAVTEWPDQCGAGDCGVQPASGVMCFRRPARGQGQLGRARGGGSLEDCEQGIP